MPSAKASPFKSKSNCQDEIASSEAYIPILGRGPTRALETSQHLIYSSARKGLFGVYEASHVPSCGGVCTRKTSSSGMDQFEIMNKLNFLASETVGPRP
eukprot:1207704-Pyramimonas_sp.AAC.4